MVGPRALLVVAMLGLAGCSDAPAPSDEDESFDDVELKASDTTGVIRGIVIDAAITPVAGATVTVIGNSVETTTDEQGRFFFESLDQGTYFLHVEKPGYATVQQSAEVAAGVASPPIIKVLLQRVPGTEPFVLSLSFVGYIGCAVKVANLVQDNVCGLAGGIDPDKNEVIVFGTDQVPHLLQTEILWEHTQEFGRQLGTIQYVQDDGGSRQRIGNVWGESPLICTVTRDAVCDNGDGTGGGGDGLNETGFPGNFWARVYAACVPQCVYGAVGFGLVLQQDYSLFSTAFFNWLPPEGWSLVRDGAIEPPE